MNQAEINKRLAIIKYLYILGKEALLSGSPIRKATCVLHFHDSVESFFTLVAEIVGVNKKNLSFMDYFEEIKIADTGKGNRELTYKFQISKLNKLRVNFKHYSILPNEEECISLKVNLDDFLNENVPKFCGMDFSRISLANSIQDEKARKLTQEAESLLEEKKYKNCLSKLGLVFYILFHKSQKKTKNVFGKSAQGRNV
jgi:hypothetical protein